MQPTDSLVDALEEFYDPTRVSVIKDRFARADDTIAEQTLVGQPMGGDQPSTLYIALQEPAREPRTEKLDPGEYLIGRATKCRIMIADREVSRMHCLLVVHSDSRITLRDLRSANKTFVNGQQLGSDERRTLKTGDRILIGSTSATLLRI